MKNLIFALFSSSFLISCSTLFPNKSRLHQVTDVGVVSLFEDRLPVQYLGKPKKELTAKVPGWSLSKSISDELQNGLKNRNKKAFELSVDPKVIQAHREQATSLKDIYLGNRWQQLETYLISEAEKQGAQYLFVIHPANHDSFPTYRAGLGFICPVQNEDLQGYAMLRAQLWNVKTKEVEARVNITPSDLQFKTGKTCAEAVKMSPEKIASLYKEQVLDLARKSADLVITRTDQKN